MKILKGTETRQDETALMLHKLKTQLKDKICSKEGRYLNGKNQVGLKDRVFLFVLSMYSNSNNVEKLSLTM